MIVARTTLKPRGTDAWGCGDYGASRGTRTHKGIDLLAEPADEILSPVKGRVSKHGYPYTPVAGDQITYRYVEITDYQGNRHRLFYCEPSAAVDLHVDTSTVIGIAQDISSKYSTPDKLMGNHIHYEIIDKNGDYADPGEFYV